MDTTADKLLELVRTQGLLSSNLGLSVTRSSVAILADDDCVVAEDRGRSILFSRVAPLHRRRECACNLFVERRAPR